MTVHFSSKYRYNLVYVICSSEGKPVLEDGLSEVAAGLLAAYDSGELLQALEEGKAGWQKWVKSFGKSLKRKVRFSITWVILRPN